MTHAWVNSRPERGDNCYYSILRLEGDGMAALRELFPKGEANDLNFALFSTSGVHGTYCTIESVESRVVGGDENEPSEVTFVVVQPRIVCMRYGNAEPRNADDIEFLKRLRTSSHRAAATVGAPA